MSLLSGLDSLGIDNITDANIFEKPKPKKPSPTQTAAPQKPKTISPEQKEIEATLDRKYKCPVCTKEFTSKGIKTGKARQIATDDDLRPRFQDFDANKYGAVVCPNCGFAAIQNFVKTTNQIQVKYIKEGISKNFKGIPPESTPITYDEAIQRFKLCLVNTIVKKAPNSERAYTCLKIAWLLRGKREDMQKKAPEYLQPIDKLAQAQLKSYVAKLTPEQQKEAAEYYKALTETKKEEIECLSNAYQGFSVAISTENFPMCGMDDSVVSYLLAALAVRLGKLDEASKLISRVITSRVAKESLKEKARDLKDIIMKKQEANKNSED